MGALAGLVDRGLVAEDWAEGLAAVDGRIAKMGEFLRSEIAAGRTYLPSGDRILHAFHRPLAQGKGSRVGQRTSPTPGHVPGLSFRVRQDVRPFPKSLINIFR